MTRCEKPCTDVLSSDLSVEHFKIFNEQLIRRPAEYGEASTPRTAFARAVWSATGCRANDIDDDRLTEGLPFATCHRDGGVIPDVVIAEIRDVGPCTLLVGMGDEIDRQAVAVA